MGLLHTESFIAFGKYAGDDTYSTPNTTARNAYTANLKRAGYDVVTSANTSEATSGGFVVRTDPVASDRNALVHSCGNTVAGNQGVTAAIRKAVPVGNDAIIGGFSVFIPTEFVKATTTSTVTMLRMAAAAQSDASWSTVAITPLYTAKEIMRISGDLLIRWGTDAALSSKTLVAGRLNYVEFRISNGDVKVWLDDVLVMQKTVPLDPETIALIFENNINATGGTQMTGAAGRWAISNWYMINEDERAPNVRLGPSTRVIGARPDQDIDVHFQRPVGPTTNAAVAGQDLVDAPTQSLQTATVGDYDIYATSTDTSTASGSLIHAVVTKVLAANLETNAHTLRPTIKSGASESVDTRSRVYELRTPISARNIRGMARRASDSKIFACGSASSIYSTPANGDGTSWASISDDGSGDINVGIAIRSDGVGVIANSNRKIYVMAAGSDTWTQVVPSGISNNLNAVVVLPDGTFVLGSVNGVALRSSTPATPGSWLSSQTAVGADIVAFAFNTVINRLLATTVTSGTAYSSDNSGQTWTSRSTTVGGTFNAATFDGTAFLIGQTTTDGTGTAIIRRSTDATSFAATTPLVSLNPGAGAVIYFGITNPANAEVIFGGTNGALSVSKDGLSYRSLPRLTSNTLRCGVITAAGDYLFAGDAGTLISYKSASIDRPLASLAGYLPTFNYAVFDPATSTNWTPNAASLAKFGMRLTT